MKRMVLLPDFNVRMRDRLPVRIFQMDCGESFAMAFDSRLDFKFDFRVVRHQYGEDFFPKFIHFATLCSLCIYKLWTNLLELSIQE